MGDGRWKTETESELASLNERKLIQQRRGKDKDKDMDKDKYENKDKDKSVGRWALLAQSIDRVLKSRMGGCACD